MGEAERLDHPLGANLGGRIRRTRLQSMGLSDRIALGEPYTSADDR